MFSNNFKNFGKSIKQSINNSTSFISFLFSIILLICITTSANAQLRVSKIFNNGMVLQRDMDIPIWGWADAGDTVKVTLNSISDSTIVNVSGRWQINLPSMSAGGPYSMKVETSTQTINRTSVYIGDVWLASGQSNMEFTVSGSDSATQVIAAADDQLIRQFKVSKSSATEPEDELVDGIWTPATSTYVGNFSAVAYFFALNLRQHIDIPIGILNISYGGSRIEAWMSEEMLGYDETDTTMAAGETERQPTLLYNKMIHPIYHYAVKGFLWYQGESNADNMEDALAYSDNFKNLINSWRDLWGLGDIPFYWVQLPNYGTPSDEPSTWDAWPILRAGQSDALSLPNTGEAVTIDVGGEDIHPTYKQPVGYRLSVIARKFDYGEDIVYSGPRYKNNKLHDDGHVVIHFDHIGSGLMAKDSLGGKVGSFAIAGDDEKFYWAQSAIDGDSVIVWNDGIMEPAIVRYAWEYNPIHANLYNAEKLPASPFKVYVNPGFKIAYFRSTRTAVEEGQSATLSWLVFGASSITLNGISVDSTGTQSITPMNDTTYTLIATNRENESEKDTATVSIIVLDPTQINRALNRPVKASTYQDFYDQVLLPIYVVDGDLETRWSSAYDEEDPNVDDNPNDEWIEIEFEYIIDIESVILSWEAAYGSQYDLEVSYDGYLWKSVYEEHSGDGSEDYITFEDKPSGRFIRMHGLNRGTQFGFSLYEFAVYGTISDVKPPTVTVNTNLGNVITVGTEVTVTADADDEDGEVLKAVFYVDNDSIGVDDAIPFQINWMPTEAKEYKISAVVIDDSNYTVQSDPLTIYADDGSTITRFEAEDAYTTGQADILISGSTSGRKYMELRDAWTITFNNIGVPKTGEYLLTIAYMLNFGSPKSQYLVINGDTTDVVEFTALNTSAWLQKGIMVQLQVGTNEIAIHGFWNWMNLDFIGVRGATIVSVKDDTELPRKHSLQQNYPNPFNPSTDIQYSIPKKCHVLLEIYDSMGRRVNTLVNQEKAAGTYTYKFNAKGLATGIYLCRLKTSDGYVETKKITLLK